MQCPKCGHEYHAPGRFCKECGSSLTGVTTTEHLTTDANSPPETVSEALPDDSAILTAAVALNEEKAEEAVQQPPALTMNLRYAAHHERGPVKENDQDYVRQMPISFPLHQIEVVITAGADGVGGAARGERWAQATVDLFLGAFGTRMPGFDDQERFVDHGQFLDLINSKVKTWLFPTVNWVTQCINSFGTQEMGEKKHYGCTFVLTILVCDRQTGKIFLYGYSVGDSSIFLLTRDDKIEKLTTDHSAENGALERLIGYGHANADGNLIEREYQLNLDFPSLLLFHCSDGVTTKLSPEGIEEICRRERPKQAVQTLITRAMNEAVPYATIRPDNPDPSVTLADDNGFAAITSTVVKLKKERS